MKHLFLPFRRSLRRGGGEAVFIIIHPARSIDLPPSSPQIHSMLSSQPSLLNTPSSTSTPSRVVRFSQFEEQQSWDEPKQTKMNEKIEIKETDMKPNMVSQAMDIVRDGLQKHTQDKDVASFVKDNLEKQFGPTWHCVVGKSFGSRVSYELETFALLKSNQLTVLVFKCG